MLKINICNILKEDNRFSDGEVGSNSPSSNYDQLQLVSIKSGYFTMFAPHLPRNNWGIISHPRSLT